VVYGSNNSNAAGIFSAKPGDIVTVTVHAIAASPAAQRAPRVSRPLGELKVTSNSACVGESSSSLSTRLDCRPIVKKF